MNESLNAIVLTSNPLPRVAELLIPSHRIPSHRIVNPGLLSCVDTSPFICFVVFVCLSFSFCVFVSVIVVVMSSVNMSTGVSIERLDGSNYHVWKFKMQLSWRTRICMVSSMALTSSLKG